MSQINNKFLAGMPANTLKGNNTGSTANPADLTVAQLQAMLSVPTSGSPLSIGSGGTGQVTAAAAFTALSPMTTAGDMIYEDATPAPSRLPIGTTGQVLTVVSGLPTWTTAAAAGANVTLSNLTSPTAIPVDLIPAIGETSNIGSQTNSWNQVWAVSIQDPNSGNEAFDIEDRVLLDGGGNQSVDANNRLLNNGTTSVFTWADGLGTGGGGFLDVKTNLLSNVADPVSPQDAATMNWVNTRITGGTVTSVALADGSTIPIYTVSGSPVTGSGTLTQTLNTQVANAVFAGPGSGSAAQPTFRALVAADIPNLSTTYVTKSEVGVASGVAGLDGGGKVPLSQLPSALMEFQGNWNPNTNTPTLVDGTGTTGFTYWVSAVDTGTVAGLSDPSMTNFQVGDLVIYNGTVWVLTTPAAGVQSVNGAQGAVVISTASANGFAGTYSGGVLTVSTTVTGLLHGNGTAISAATAGTDYVVPSGSITGTAANITATSNSTLTTLSALSLPTSQLTGDIALATQVSGTLPIANGGTGQVTAAAAFNALAAATAAGGLIVGSGTNAYSNLPIGTTGQVLTVVAGTAAWSATAATATWNKETFTDAGNQQTFTLAHTPLANSVSFLVVGAGDQLEGIDFSVSSNVLTLLNDLATGGVSALVTGDIVQVQYQY